MKRKVAVGGTCPSRKTRFRDHESAKRRLENFAHDDRRAVTPVRAYECPLCAGWHLTSQALKS